MEECVFIYLVNDHTLASSLNPKEICFVIMIGPLFTGSAGKKRNIRRSIGHNLEEGSISLQICKSSSQIGEQGFYGVMVSTLDSESSDPSSNLGRTWDKVFSYSIGKVL